MTAQVVRQKETYYGAALAALAALTYAGTLGYDFVWDDALSVQRWLPALRTWWSPFFPLTNIPQFPYSYYRPLQLISYLIDRATGGGAPWTFHLTTVTLHVVATFLVFRVGLRLFDGYPTAWRTALWAGLLFAVHPIHSESVAWMGARPDPMVSCFGLGAILVYQRMDWSPMRRSCVAAALVFLALLSKENAIAMLLLVPASTLALQRRAQARSRKKGKDTPPPAPRWTAYLPFVFVGVAWATLRSVAMQGAAPPRMPEEPVRTLIGALGKYLSLLVFPYPHNAFIADVPMDTTALLVGGLAIVVYTALLWRAWRQGHWPLVFSLAWIPIALAPSFGVINMYPTAPLAERYLYVPSIGFCWAFGAAVAAAYERERRIGLAAQSCAAVLVVIAFALTLNRNPDWKDDYTSWKDTAEQNPVDGLPMRNYAAATLKRGNEAEAQQVFEEALGRRNNPGGERLIYNNLGTLAVSRGDDFAAESYYRKALRIEPSADSIFNLALLLLRRAIDRQITPDAGVRAEKLREARQLLDRALAASPHDPDIYIGLAHVAEATGDSTEARRRFEQALELDLPPETEAAVRRRMAKLN